MGWRIRIREDEAHTPDPFLSPDLLLTVNIGPELHFDHALSDPDETQNRMGLRSKEGLHTAVIIQLFTDRRIREDQTHPDPRSPDPRGWWGDSVDVRSERGETEMGSHLWLLRRSILTQETLALAEEYCHEALAPIVAQGAVARFDVRAEAQSLRRSGHPATGLLALQIDGFAQDGLRKYQQQFEVLWDQIDAIRR